MSRQRNIPNAENFTLKNLETAPKAAPNQSSCIRFMAINALLIGLSRERVAALFDVNEDSVSRWARRFNDRGIDGLTYGSGSRFPPRSVENEFMNTAHSCGGFMTRTFGLKSLAPRPMDGQEEKKGKALIEPIRVWICGFLTSAGSEEILAPEKPLREKRRQGPSSIRWGTSPNDVTGMVLPRKGEFYALKFVTSQQPRVKLR